MCQIDTIHRHFEVIKKTGQHFFSSTKHPPVNVQHFDQQMAEKSINWKIEQLHSLYKEQPFLSSDPLPFQSTLYNNKSHQLQHPDLTLTSHDVKGIIRHNFDANNKGIFLSFFCVRTNVYDEFKIRRYYDGWLSLKTDIWLPVQYCFFF